MSLLSLDDLPEESRIWVFGADRRLEPGETAHLLDQMRRFLEDWTAHRRELDASLDWLHHRFLVVGVDASGAGASGCSVDGLMRRIRELEDDLEVGLADTSSVWFRDPREEGRIRTVSRSRFRELAREGRVGPDTVVFDPAVERAEELRAGGWQRPVAESWHASLLPESAPEGSGAGG